MSCHSICIDLEMPSMDKWRDGILKFPWQECFAGKVVLEAVILSILPNLRSPGKIKIIFFCDDKKQYVQKHTFFPENFVKLWSSPSPSFLRENIRFSQWNWIDPGLGIPTVSFTPPWDKKCDRHRHFCVKTFVFLDEI